MSRNTATRRESTDTNTAGPGADIDESQFATGSAQTPTFCPNTNTALSNNLHIFGQHGTVSEFPFESDEQHLANKLWRKLQLNSPNPGSPSSSISQSRIYTDLYGPPSVSTIYTDLYDPQSVSTVLTDTDLDDTDVIESHNSFENIGNLPNNQDQHGEDMALDLELDPAVKKSRGNEDFFL